MKKFTLKKFLIKNLNQEYDVFLEFKDNKKIIVSENGSGKTTILNIFHSFFSLDYKSISSYEFDSIILTIDDDKVFSFSKLLLRTFLNKERLDNINEFINSDFIEVYSNFIKKNKIHSKEDKTQKLTTSFIVLIYIFIYENKFTNRIIKNVTSFLKDEIHEKSNNEILKIIKDYETILSLYFHNETDLFNINDNTLKIENNSTKFYKDIIIEKNNDSDDLIDSMKYQLLIMEKLFNVFNDFKNLNIIYLPTYRRIEHNIDALLKDSNEYNFINDHEIKERFSSNKLIQFGIEDVENTWENISNDLRNSMIEGFNKFSGSMLKNSISFKNPTRNEISKLSQELKIIQIIFERLGEENIPKETKQSIIDILKSKDKNNEKYYFLYYMLINLIKIYKNQEKSEKNIKLFTEILNHFFSFNNKKIIYDENSIAIRVSKKYQGEYKLLSLSNLSSGEKQIISLFTQLLLKDTNEDIKYWIIIDEPELSLSIEWQKILLPNILKTNKCEFLFATTHSPFIFSNDLKNYTSDLSLEMKESNNE